MKESAKAHEIFGQSADRAFETLTLWADANQRVLQELVEFSAVAAKESTRLYSELQQSSIDALRDTQTGALRWQTTWPQTFQNPRGWCQKALVESADGAEKALRLIEANAGAITRSAERLQASAELAGKGIRDALTTVVSRVKEPSPQN